MKRPFYLMLLILLVFCLSWLLYRSYTAVSLTSGACATEERPLYQTIIRETDSTTWCLSGLPRTAIRWQWSPDRRFFAYALQDKNNPTSHLSGRWGYAEIDLLNWYIMNADGTGHRQFSAPDPHYLRFIANGEYAEYTTYNDYGRSEHEVVNIPDGSLVCRYNLYNLWYSEGKPPCSNIQLSNGTMWDIKTERTRSACEFHITSVGWFDQLNYHNCRELLAGTDLVPPPTPTPPPYPIETQPPEPAQPSYP